MLEFFESVQQAFARNRESTGSFAWSMAVLTAVVVAWLTLAVFRRRRQRRLALEDFIDQRGLPEEDSGFARALAAAAKVEPMELLTHLDVFEHATAAALSGAVAIPEQGAALAQHVHRLREALHFDRVPAHAPLLTTRELTPGTALDCGATHGQISELDEQRFVVELTDTSGAEGTRATLRVRHAREALYELDCRVLERDGRRLVLAHDEHPRRIQQREFVRIEHRAPVTLTVLSRVGHALPTMHLAGELRDLSAGGALVVVDTPLPPGTTVTLASLHVGGVTFTGLRAVVLSAEQRDGKPHLHLEFRITERERDRLVAATLR